MAIKLSEKESLRKSFTLFFLVIELLLGFIFYQYYTIEEEHLQENLSLEMKNYSFTFEGNQFDIDIVLFDKSQIAYELYQNKKSLYILVPLPNEKSDVLKVYYEISKYHEALGAIRTRLIKQFLLLSLIAIFISFWFSTYILTPLRDSITLLEIFIKDIIHDLNTPLSSILINLKMMNIDTTEAKSIQYSVKTISMLHNNLDEYLKESHIDKELFNIEDIVEEQVEFFSTLYSYLEWDIDISELNINSDPKALSRVIYNLISNACKYNTSRGYISIKSDQNRLIITNPSYGIKEPKRVFDRFYKESDRGIGIGLHIVKKLCKELSIDKNLIVEDKQITFILDFSKTKS